MDHKHTGNAQFPCQRCVEGHCVGSFTNRPNGTSVVVSLSSNIDLQPVLSAADKPIYNINDVMVMGLYRQTLHYDGISSRARSSRRREVVEVDSHGLSRTLHLGSAARDKRCREQSFKEQSALPLMMFHESNILVEKCHQIRELVPEFDAGANNREFTMSPSNKFKRTQNPNGKGTTNTR